MRRSSRFLRTMLCAVLATVLLAAVLEAADETPTAPAPADLSAKRQAIRERIDVARRLQDEQQAAATDKTASTSSELETLKQLDAVYAQQQAAADRAAELATAANEVRERSRNPQEALNAEGPPYSFLLLDSLRDELKKQQQRVQTQDVAYRDARTRLQQAKKSAEDQRRDQRRNGTAEVPTTQDAAGTKPDGETAASPVTVADETVKLREAELRNEETALDTANRQLELLEKQIDLVEPAAQFSYEDLTSQLEALDKLKRELESRQEARETALEYKGWELARVDEELNSPDADKELLAAEQSTYRDGQSCEKERINLIIKQIERVGKRRDAWDHRHKVANRRAASKELWAWQEDAEKSVAEALADIRSEQGRIDELRAELANIQEKADSAERQDLKAAGWYRKDVQQRIELIEAHGRYITSLEDYVRLEEKLIAEIEDRTVFFSLSEWIEYISDRAVALWVYEPYSTDDEGVSVGQICQGLVLLLLGLAFSRRVSRMIGNRLLPRLGVDDGAASALESLIFYALLTTLSLTALHIVRVPLTMFAFMGGALAIGLGFGSQKILNNFVSGLILLIERPVRTSDLIEIDGITGIVQHIGTRSTRISTATNVEIIVPNSTFLETNVVNWTLSDTTIRACVSVGVAYGSPAREVARWLKRAADEHGLVLAKPAPFVWFTGFGDNALEFDLHFYITMRNLSERKRIESDLRFMIDQYFNDAGIVIAFPQRDIHLDTKQAIDVRLLPAADGQDDEAQTSTNKAA